MSVIEYAQSRKMSENDDREATETGKICGFGVHASRATSSRATWTPGETKISLE